MNERMITTTFTLNLGFTVEEIYNYFCEDLESMFKAREESSWGMLATDREQWLGKWCSPERSINAEVKALILDLHEGFDWDKLLASDELEPTVKTGFQHAEAINCLTDQGVVPATRWPLLCFGYQNRNYFCELKHSPRWLIAPGMLGRLTTDHPWHFHDRLIVVKNPAEVLKVLIQYYGPGRVCALQMFGAADHLVIPPNLTVEDIDDFVEHNQATSNEVYEVTVGQPSAVCTKHRAAFMFDYSDPTYPRVLGIQRT